MAGSEGTSARDDTLGSPRGYREATRLGHSPWRVFLAGHLLLLLAVLVFGGLLWATRGPETIEILIDDEAGATSGSFAIDVGRVGVPIFVGMVVTVVVHEYLHGLAYRALGYDVTYGVSAHAGAFYAAAFHQYQTREDGIRVALAPIVAITVAATPLLFVPVPTVAITALVSLVFNTAGSVGDVLFVWRVLRLSEGTLLYDSGPGRSYAFEPAPGDAPRDAPRPTARSGE